MIHTRNRKTTKKQIGARLSIILIDRIDAYIARAEKRGLDIKKVNILEQALYEYMEKIENEGK